MQDRIELGTYVVAASLVGKKIAFKNVEPNLIKTELKVLRKIMNFKNKDEEKLA